MDFTELNIEKYRQEYLDLDFIGNFLSNEESEKLYNILLEKVKWKKTRTGRHNCTYGEDGLEYVISWYGKTTVRKAIDWKHLEELLPIKNKLEQITNQKYNICVIQFYPNGNVGINPHRDREMKYGTTICGLSLGETRTLSMLRKEKKLSLNLNPGSLYIFNPPTNNYWAHSIEKDNTKNPRISLTFRNYE